jgi:hypothetical protein
MPRKLAKSNVQTTLCDPGEPANASSLYLAVTLPWPIPPGLTSNSFAASLFRAYQKQDLTADEALLTARSVDQNSAANYAAILQTELSSCVSHRQRKYSIGAQANV